MSDDLPVLMMVSNTVSIALCTYNGAAYLPAQLESILAQSRLPDELVVGDDCSTDSTVKILEQFAARAPFPVHIFVNEKNLGSSCNFGQTIARCKGDFIALCDQDDVWLPSKLAKLLAVLEAWPDVGLVFSDAELVDEDLTLLGRRLWEITFPDHEHEQFLQGRWLDILNVHEVVTGATMVFRSSLRDIVLPIPSFPTIIHDGWATFVIGTVATLAFVSEPLILYRQHGSQQMGVGLKISQQNKLGASQNHSADKRRAENLNKRIERLSEMLLVHGEVDRRTRNWPSDSVARRHIDSRADMQRSLHDLEDLRAHYLSRTQLPGARWRRIIPILRELRTRRYHRFSRGIVSALKDVAL
jgi:glycosyltransferase involved in cell wall biosynthesis